MEIFKTNEHPACDLLGWLVSQSSVYHLVRISIHDLFLGFDNAQTKITPINPKHIYESFGFQVIRELTRYDKKYWIYLLKLTPNENN